MAQVFQRTALSALIIAGLGALISLWMATQFIAGAFDHQSVLGAPLIGGAEHALYLPWAVLEWSARWSDLYPRPFAVAHLIVLTGFIVAILAVVVGMRRGFQVKPFGANAWASLSDVQAASLFADRGMVLGKFEGEIVAFDGPEHQLLIGASRSGKGRGHVVPTLLATQHSALVIDVKGELADGDPRHGFPGTAGFRETLGPVMRFAPTRADSIRFNPLFEIPRGADEVRAAQI
ncbi:MAG: type IV secretory system conjugative DNA transfer family protein [Caulobacteraceae bacterium]|nr:type IV secretory system conjugative DNA transfer family protein [Caulobacteraceae bacterium]